MPPQRGFRTSLTFHETPGGGLAIPMAPIKKMSANYLKKIEMATAKERKKKEAAAKKVTKKKPTKKKATKKKKSTKKKAVHFRQPA